MRSDTRIRVIEPTDAVAHAGSRLLVDLAEATGLESGFGRVLAEQGHLHDDPTLRARGALKERA